MDTDDTSVNKTTGGRTGPSEERKRELQVMIDKTLTSPSANPPPKRSNRSIRFRPNLDKAVSKQNSTTGK